MVVHYTRGFSERPKTYNSLGLQVHFIGSYTICTLLMTPRMRTIYVEKGGVIYWFKCLHTDCPEKYIGKSGRTFGNRFREHLRTPSPIPSTWPDHRTPSEFGVFYHSGQGGRGCHQDHKGGHVHSCK